MRECRRRAPRGPRRKPASASSCRSAVNISDPLTEFTELKDEFKSGKDLNSPGMQQILADIDSGRPSFGTLVVWQLDRLSRNLADAAPLFERLRDAGLGFVAIRQPYLSATGAMARAISTRSAFSAGISSFRSRNSSCVAPQNVWQTGSDRCRSGLGTRT